MSSVLLLLTAPAWRGSGVSFKKIRAALQAHGHQVTALVACAEVALELEKCPGEVVQLPISGSGWKTRRSIRAKWGNRQFDLVLTDSPRDVRIASLANLGPIVWRVNLPNRPVPADPWSRYLFRRVRHLVFQSHFIQKLTCDGAPWLKALPQSVIANGYDPELWRPDQAGAMTWREKMGISADTPLVVTVAALSREKAIPETLVFSRQLARLLPGMRHLVIGEGADRADLEAQAGPQVSFIGNLDAESTRDAMRAADLVTHFSRREVFPNVVAEAMALGAVVLGADTGGVAEVMGGAGVTINPDKPQDAAATAFELLQHPEQRQLIGQRARQRIVSQYPGQKMANAWAGLVEQLTSVSMGGSQRRSLLLSYDFPPISGGIARWMEGLVRSAPPGTILVSTGGKGSADERDFDQSLGSRVDRIAVPPDRLRTLQGLLRWGHRSVRLARDRQVKFAWANPFRPAGVVAWWTERKTALPYGIIFHGGDILSLREKLRKHAWKRRLHRAVIRRAAVLVVNSHWTAERARELLMQLDLPEHSSRIRVIHPGTDPDHWRASKEEVASFMARHQLPAGRWLVTVARLVAHKGIDTTIDLLATLAPEYPQLHYAIVGRGPARLALESRVRELALSGRVHFLDHLDDEELPSAYRMADLVMGLSREAGTEVEGFGITFLEAAASERAVVAGASGGTADAVIHGVTGLLVSPGSPAEAVAAVRQLLEDPERCARLGAAGAARVRDGFTWSRVVQEFESTARELGRK